MFKSVSYYRRAYPHQYTVTIGGKARRLQNICAGVWQRHGVAAGTGQVPGVVFPDPEIGQLTNAGAIGRAQVAPEFHLGVQVACHNNESQGQKQFGHVVGCFILGFLPVCMQVAHGLVRYYTPMFLPKKTAVKMGS